METHQQSSKNGTHRLASGLGWFSIGLGVAEMIAPGKLAQFIGVENKDRTRSVLRTYGLREFAAGVGILSKAQPTNWIWARLAGDLMDLASLTSALSSSTSDRTRVAAATAAVLGVTALDAICVQKMTGGNGKRQELSSSPVIEAVLVNRSPEEVYKFWRDLENFPSFMAHIQSVEVQGDRQSHWKAKGPAGTTVEWDAEIVQDEPNHLIKWRSVNNPDVHNSGTVRFDPAPGKRGTFVRVELQYAPPGGAVGSLIAKLFGKEPGQQLYEDLRRFKQIVETGEILQSDASIHSGMHAAQPPAPQEELKQENVGELQPSMA
jgi:uncharacterized membrane protein